MHDEKPIGERYRSAASILHESARQKLALNAVPFPVWIDAAVFWYVRQTKAGKEYRVVDAAAGSNRLMFDHSALATALSVCVDEPVDGQALPITDEVITLEPLTVEFLAFDRRWRYNAASQTCTEIERDSRQQSVSPDGKYVAFVRDWNVWLRDRETGEERAVTTDGTEHNVYGACSSGWGFENGLPHLRELQVLWSPDSARLLTVQRDTRNVASLPVVHHVPTDQVRPVLQEKRVALPGDEGIETVRLLSIEASGGAVTDADWGVFPTTRNGYGFFTSGMGWWSKDGRRAYFVDVDRYYKSAKVVEFDVESGACRLLFEETSDTHINLMLNQDAFPSFLPLPETGELLWFSERTGWAHLYLYDLDTGALKKAVTSGPGLVRNIVKYIPARREAFVQMAARQEGRDPYYKNLVRVNIDTGKTTTVADGNHDYVVIAEPDDMYKIIVRVAGCPAAACGVSDDGGYAVVTRSRADEAPISYVIDRRGEHVMDFEEADLSALPGGWVWPEPVAIKAADGATDIYGLVFRPSGFDPDKKWPVICHGFNQPEIAWVSKGSFTAGLFAGWPFFDAAAVAELGFIVVQVDGRGSPEREKVFFDHSYGRFETASHIDDHVAAIQQLAERYPYMDLGRVGFAGHTSGGSGGVQALLRHPDVFKAATVIAHHDGRLMSAQMQGDKYDGPDACLQDRDYPEDDIDQLQGKLLLMSGMLDVCTPPAATFRLVDALQKANKDFDMILLPNLGHGDGDGGQYLMRRAWDFLVKQVMGEEPPEEFDLAAPK